jgi:hypothetical protein
VSSQEAPHRPSLGGLEVGARYRRGNGLDLPIDLSALADGIDHRRLA